jgi:transposase-like protein
MPGNWTDLDCPSCGHTHPPPEQMTTDCDFVIADLVCPECQRAWQVRIELWRYYGIEEALPSREQDR